MSLVESFKNIVAAFPLADIKDERLALAADCFSALEKQLSVTETKIGQLEAEVQHLQAANAKLAAEVKAESLDHQQTQHELDELRAEHEEEVRLISSIEFRRGKRTNGQWVPFCPSCHVMATIGAARKWVHCSMKCGWIAQEAPQGIDAMIGQMESQRSGR